jgi:hypothetical protein
MGRVHEQLTDDLIDWIGRQHVFFVASAPSGPEGHVNVSPKGHDTFRVLGPTTVAYLDLTGSGIETIAHLRDNGRITLMFCAFDGKPRILRLFGRGEAITTDDERFADLAATFPELPGTRAIIRCELDRIGDSCGYSIPFLTYEGERETLIEWAERRGPDGIVSYHEEKNRTSIDGLAGLPVGADGPVAPTG